MLYDLTQPNVMLSWDEAVPNSVQLMLATYTYQCSGLLAFAVVTY